MITRADTTSITEKYPETLVNDSVRKAKTYVCEELLKIVKPHRINNNIITFVSDFNPTIKDPS